MPDTCCNILGDVRGLCYFGLQGNEGIGAISVDDLITLRKCPNLTYAIAYWIFNNHRDEWDARNITFWTENAYISLLLNNDYELFTKIHEILVDMECDENDDDDESESSSEDEPVQVTNNNTDLSGDPI